MVIRLNTGARESRADTPSNQNPGQGRVEKANQGKNGEEQHLGVDLQISLQSWSIA